MGSTLLVDDDVDMRVLIRIKLAQDTRLTISGEAASTSEALDMAREHKPELVILDHYIEGDTMGVAAAPMIKEASPDSKIILLTTHDLATEVEREPAIDAYVRKRHLSELLPTARQLLGLSA